MPRRNTPRGESTRAGGDARPPGLDSHWRRDGSTKTSYMSRGEALSVADETFRDAGVRLDVYRCSVCSAWHMGNPLERDD